MRNFLRINDSREFLVFLFFLLAAFVFWYLTTMNQEYEMPYNVKLELQNLPDDVLVTESLPKGKPDQGSRNRRIQRIRSCQGDPCE